MTGTAVQGESASFYRHHAQAIMKAEALLDRGFFPEALAKFRRVADQANDPDQKARALFFIGKINSVCLDQPAAALSLFNKIVTDYPTSSVSSDAFFETGIMFFDRKQYRKAYSIFTTFAKTYPWSMRCKAANIWAGIARDLLTNNRKTKLKSKIERIRPVNNRMLRVLIRNPEKRIRVRSSSTIDVADQVSKKMVYSGWGPVELTATGNRILINGHDSGVTACSIRTPASVLQVDGACFRGHFAIHVRDKKLYAINHVKFEEYLYGVIPEEMPPKWDKQALMAQAVAARTYALCMKHKNRHEDYDIEATTAAQVYGGYSAENMRTTAAVDATKGQVMTHNGRPIVAYFHSNSGGHTEDPVHVWNVKIPYLQAVPDNFSASAPGNGWEYFLPYDMMKTSLEKNGFSVGRIEQLKIIERSPSGRNRTIRIVAKKRTLDIPGNLFRAAMGETKIKSTMFKAVPCLKGVMIKGKGYGHGVGMSQWGARKMAMTGRSYRDILKYYYHGIKIMMIDNLKLIPA